MTSIRTYSLASLLLLSATAASAATPQVTATGPVDLQTASCGQFQTALFMANPGKQPSKDRLEAATAAQDVLIQGLMWVNGYLAGRDGAKTMKPFDNNFISGTIGKLSAICKANGKTMRFVDAAAKL